MDTAISFPRYKKYKDSGVEWIGEIPNEWRVESIRAITELKSEKNRPELQVLSVYREYGVIPKNSRNDNHNVTSLDTSGYKVVDVGDLVVNKMKAWQGSMGVSEHAGIVSPAYITCHVNSEMVAPRYLHYLLRSKIYIGVYNALSYGVRVGQWDMHYEDFKGIPVPLPDLNTQQRIANFLDQKTAEIDAAIAKKQRLIELLKEQKAILINQAVTQGLDPNVPMRDSGVEWIGKVPEHWSLSKIGHYGVVSNGSTPSRDVYSYWYQGTVPWLSSGKVNDAEITESSELITERALRETSVRLYLPGTVVIGIVGQGKTRGTVSIMRIAACINQNMAAIEPSKKLSSEFLHGYLTQAYEQIRNIGKGSNQEALNCELVSSFPVVVPPLDEQQTISQHVNSLEKLYSKMTQCAMNEIDYLNEFKQILISEAVTGKIKL